MNINDFQTLLINRNEIEKILGKTITRLNSEDDYLEDYRMFAELSLHDVTCLLLGLHPKDWNAHQHYRYEVIREAIQQSAENSYIPARIETDINGNTTDVFLTHETAAKWAKTHGLKWNVPPYRQIINDNVDDPTQAATILQQSEEIKRLQAENAELKAQLKKNEQQQSSINYDKFSIHGHTSENLQFAFKLAKIIAEKCDPDNPHSYPTKEDFEEYVKKYYSDSSKLAVAFYQILTPEKVKTRGKTPIGVDTFQGLI